MTLKIDPKCLLSTHLHLSLANDFKKSSYTFDQYQLDIKIGQNTVFGEVLSTPFSNNRLTVGPPLSTSSPIYLLPGDDNKCASF